MNLRPPPDTENIKQLKEWCFDLYRFLQYPAFHQLQIVSRSEAPTDTTAGVVYYDSDDNKLYCYNGTTWKELYS